MLETQTKGQKKRPWDEACLSLNWQQRRSSYIWKSKYLNTHMVPSLSCKDLPATSLHRCLIALVCLNWRPLTHFDNCILKSSPFFPEISNHRMTNQNYILRNHMMMRMMRLCRVVCPQWNLFLAQSSYHLFCVWFYGKTQQAATL